MIRYAVVADPHVHDCSWVPSNNALTGAIRSFADTRASTRVFNESIPAFRAALQQVADAGIKIVLLVGDLTDDGQRPNIDSALQIIAEYRERHGLRVLATPGNHDFFALAGRPQLKNFLLPSGEPVLLDSARSPEARTMGTAEALRLMESLGYQPQEGDLHWESPFGLDPSWDKRSYQVLSPNGETAVSMIDSSYLVEPVEGLWVLSIDANVCVPRNGALDLDDEASFLDPTSGGWDAVLRHRRHLLPWMKDVAGRARERGKALVAFSHYPTLDVLGGAAPRELTLFTPSSLARRIPSSTATIAFAETGVPLHFSGHLHVNDTACHASAAGRFINIAVPSPVGYGAAFKLVEHAADRVSITSVPLVKVPGYGAAFPAYRREAAQEGRVAQLASLTANHARFMDAHLGELVPGRYIAREWPKDMSDFVYGNTMADLLALLGLSTRLDHDFPMMVFVLDFYRLRKAGELGLPDVGDYRFALYRRLCTDVGRARNEGLAARFAELIGLLGIYISRLPNRDFIVLLPGLAVARPTEPPAVRDEPSCAIPLESAD